MRLSIFQRSLVSFILVLTFALNALALDPEVQALVTYETQANAVSQRNDKPIAIEHFEIPYELVEKDLALDRIPKELLESLTFIGENGQKYFRWMINPEDTQWYKEAEKFISSRNLRTP